MPNSPIALQSLDAWPGETARPPLRLLDRGPVRQHAEPAVALRPRPSGGWLQRVRLALAGR